MRVKGFLSGRMAKLDTLVDTNRFECVVFPVDVGIADVGCVDNPPFVIRVPVRIEGNLLF